MDLLLGRTYPEVRSSYIPLCGFHSISERALSQRRRKYNFPECEESFFLVSSSEESVLVGSNTGPL